MVFLYESTFFPNSDSELKGSSRGQKIGPRIRPGGVRASLLGRPGDGDFAGTVRKSGPGRACYVDPGRRFSLEFFAFSAKNGALA